jgi:hypothetical protein
MSVRPKRTVPTFEVLLDAITIAPTAADLALLLQTASTYFMGNQREQLEAAAAQRETELPPGDALGR